MDVQWGHPERGSLAALIGLLVLVYGAGALLRRRRRARLADPRLLPLLLPATGWRRAVRHVLLTVVTGLLLLTALDIRWGRQWRQVPQRGIEAVFLLDVSRSMLARDALPSRLDRAKQLIADLVENLAGDRIGLVVFAGTHRIMVPLTSHHTDFLQTLQEVGPDDVDQGGSRLGDALTAAAGAFVGKTADNKVILLLSDGEDQDSDPVQAAAEAHKNRGIRVDVVALGDAETGARIPVTGARDARSNDPTPANRSAAPAYLEYQGQQVWTKLDAELLRRIALATEGVFLPAETHQVDMRKFHADHWAGLQQTDFQRARFRSYIPRFPWFLTPALVLLIVATAIAPARRRTEPATIGTPSRQPSIVTDQGAAE